MAGFYTISALTQQSRNFFRNNGVLPSVEKFVGTPVCSYRGGCMEMRKRFHNLQDDDFFRLSRGHRTQEVWYFMGRRVVVEYFDENALVDVQHPLEKPCPERDAVVERLRAKLSEGAVRFDVRVVGDNDILDIRPFVIDPPVWSLPEF